MEQRCPGSTRVLPMILFSAWMVSGCVRGVFQPVNVGREYGDKVPIMISHIPKKNHWVSEYHFTQQKILCFDYMCRKMAGKRKAMRQISFEDFKKRIQKNAKKGEYKNILPPPKQKEIRKDSVPVVTPVVVSAEPDSPPPVLKSDSLIILSEVGVLFELNSYKLKGEHFAALDSLGKFLRAHPTLEVIVSGHTDSTGTERHNVGLSTKRAEVVAGYLVNQGASIDRVAYEGFGSSRPISRNNTEQGRSRNRRVEILIRNKK